MKYSVIIPVYGVEKYLDQCVESVLAQSFTDFELILVDDRSPDNCPAMCDSWAQKDCRIRVIHKPVNEGLGFARNTGMDAARGSYVLFLDSDDFVSEKLLEACDAVQTAETDMLVFGVEYVYQDRNGKTTLTELALPSRFVADTPGKRGELFVRLNRERVFPFAWNKIYRKAFLDGARARFEKTKLIEDFLFNIDLFGKAERIDSLDAALYHYRKPAHETLVSKYAPEFFELCKRKYALEKAFLEGCSALTPDNYDLIRLGYVKHFVSTVLKNRSKTAGLSRKQQLSAIGKMMADPLTVEVLAGYAPADRKYRLIADAIREKKAGLVLAYCSAIGFVQTHMRQLYRRLLKM